MARFGYLLVRSSLSDEFRVAPNRNGQGRDEPRYDLPTIEGRDGKPRSSGYGHLCGASAQIVYRDKDLVLLPHDVL
ncbi:MAG TPA: hypothetical protein VGQ39_24510 [Pyrinomonadaceae bacterium]|jgi:hypothetical protein|nr:hypothetical protein [Pyrinomonadaceae bacterium]